jgi:hypothetical protein
MMTPLDVRHRVKMAAIIHPVTDETQIKEG